MSSIPLISHRMFVAAVVHEREDVCPPVIHQAPRPAPPRDFEVSDPADWMNQPRIEILQPEPTMAYD